MVGVFDGHGSSLAADYVSAALENHVSYWLEKGERKLTNVLHKAFLDVNNAFTKYLYHNYQGEGDKGMDWLLHYGKDNYYGLAQMFHFNQM